MYFLLLLFSFPFLFPAILASNSSPEVIQIRQLQTKLAFATTAAACRSRRTAAIIRTKSRLEKARQCRYAGLSSCAYFELRDLCVSLPNLSEQLDTCVSSCPTLKQRVKQAEAACTVIGWETPARVDCPLIEPPKKRLAELKARQCPETPGETVEELQHQINILEEEARKMFGLPNPPYDTLTLDPVGSIPDNVVIMLHGLGGSIERTRPFADFLLESGLLPKTRFVLPQAKVAFNTFLNATLPSWFDILNSNINGPFAEEDIIQAAKNIDVLMEIQKKVYGIHPKRVLLFGISQGGALAITVYLRSEVGGAFIFAGYVPMVDSYPEALNPASNDAPITLTHGQDDVTVPVAVARMTRDALNSFGRDVKYIEYEGEGHNLDGVLPQVLQAAIEVFRKSLGLPAVLVENVARIAE